MKNLKSIENVVIMGSDKIVYASYYNNEQVKSNRPVKTMRFANDKLVATTEKHAKEINELHVISTFLKAISSCDDDDVVVKLYISDTMYKQIITGSFKYLLRDDAKNRVSIKEINEWKIFAKYYQKTFCNVKFVRNTIFNLKQFKYNQKEMKYGKQVCNSLKGLLNINTELENNM